MKASTELKINKDGNLEIYKPETVDEIVNKTVPVNTEVQDSEGNTLTVPEGFKIRVDDSTNNATKVTDGIVIEDEKGNQFVWIPVKREEDFKTYRGYENGKLLDDSSFETYHEPYNARKEAYEDYYQEYEKMKESVIKYHGFYVGRYEAGTTATNGSGIRGELVIKKGSNVYNNICYASGYALLYDEEDGAVEVARGMYNKKRGDSVTSNLMYGVQWDAVMQFIDIKYKDEDGTLTSFVADSTGKGNYSDDENTGTPALTGSREEYKQKNIYDLAGNVWEWTMEAFDYDSRTIRGGGYQNHTSGSDFECTGITAPASIRRWLSQPDQNANIGFRVALYL